MLCNKSSRQPFIAIFCIVFLFHCLGTSLEFKTQGLTEKKNLKSYLNNLVYRGVA